MCVRVRAGSGSADKPGGVQLQEQTLSGRTGGGFELSAGDGERQEDGGGEGSAEGQQGDGGYEGEETGRER